MIILGNQLEFQLDFFKHSWDKALDRCTDRQTDEHTDNKMISRGKARLQSHAKSDFLFIVPFAKMRFGRIHNL